MRSAAWRAVTAVATVVVVGLAPAGCTGTGPTIALGSCGVEGPDHPERCGTLEVPLDWAHPDAGTMTLQVLVVPASGPDVAADPVFYLAGFGGSALANAQWPYDHLTTLERTRDLVFVDQRGTGPTAETCDLPAPMALDAATAPDVVDACLASLQRDPRHDTTASAVKDLDLARQRLGYDEVNLYGGSYGVSIGMAYVQAHPDRVRSAVFLGGAPLDVPLWERVPTSSQGSFDQVVQRCEADPVCGPAFDPAGDLAALVGRLEQGPVTIDLGDGRTLPVNLVMFLDNVIDAYLDSAATAAALPADLAAMRRGDWAEVLRRRGTDTASLPSPLPTVLPYQVQKVTLECSDAWAAVDAAGVAAQPETAFTAQAQSRAAWQQVVCPLWPHDEGVGGTVATQAPILFLNGTADPADPPAVVADVQRTIPNAARYAVPGVGHADVVDTPCLVDLLQRFVVDAGPPPDAEWQQCFDQVTAGLPAFATD